MRLHWMTWIGRGALALLLVTMTWTVTNDRSEAQPPLAVRVLGPTSAVPVGQPFTVTLVAENVQNLGAFEFEFEFSPSIANASVGDIQIGSMLGSTGRTTGTLRLASAPGRPGVPLFGAYSYGAAGGPNGNGVLATIVMAAVSPGTSQLNLGGLKVTDVTGSELLSTAVAGSVSVVVAPHPIYLPLLLRGN